MDYGKLAYLKAEDLELRLGSISKVRRDKSFGRANYEIGRTLNGHYSVTDIKPDGGNVCLIVKLTAKAEKKGYIDILIGGRTAARQTVSGEEKEYLQLLESKITDSCTLSLNTNGIFVKGIELLIIGGSAGGGGKRLAGDSADGKAVVAYVEGETICFFEGNENSLDFEIKSYEAVGRDVDIAYINGRFYCVILDIRGNIWLFDYHSPSAFLLIGNADGASVSLSPSATGLCVAAENGGGADIYDLHSIKDFPKGYSDDILKNAINLRMSKGGDRPVLTAKTANSTFFLQPQREIKTGETVSVSIRATVV